jgi:Holliday junction resolvase RusA-like endonuclease
VAAPEPVELVVHGRPVPKARPRLGLGHTFTPQRTTAAEELIVWHCRAAKLVGRFLEGPLRIDREYHGAHPLADIDNLDKLVFDALQVAGVIRNDRQVVSGWHARFPASKDEARTVIRIKPVALHVRIDATRPT